MTTRDDLVRRLRDEFNRNDWYLRQEAATALEAKDAEIARLTVCLSNSEDQFQAKIGEVIAQMDRISDLERQLADETERCARKADSWSKPSVVLLAAGEMTAQELRTAQAVARGIASAIRGGAK